MDRKISFFIQISDAISSSENIRMITQDENIANIIFDNFCVSNRRNSNECKIVIPYELHTIIFFKTTIISKLHHHYNLPYYLLFSNNSKIFAETFELIEFAIEKPIVELYTAVLLSNYHSFCY